MVNDHGQHHEPDRLPLLASNLSLSSRLPPQISSTIARDVQHGIGRLPRQNLAVEVRQNIVSAVRPEFLAPSGILIQRRQPSASSLQPPHFLFTA